MICSLAVNGIPTFIGYFMSTLCLEKDGSDIIKPVTGIYIFRKIINSKVIVIAQLQFEPTSRVQSSAEAIKPRGLARLIVWIKFGIFYIFVKPSCWTLLTVCQVI